jgi:hypothetical protein
LEKPANVVGGNVQRRPRTAGAAFRKAHPFHRC